jgi:acyl-[acyl-carrier-protein]-phospholipid O-acyltransferase/long-chain-fatty-acid--[acyl-carrier-protein] ligase
MATLLCGKVIVNLNYSASNEAVRSAIEQAEIKTVYTAKKFLSKLNARGIDFSDCFENVNVVFMEDLKEEIGKAELAMQWLLTTLLPAFALKVLYSRCHDAGATAAILFSSGSEGSPKGIMLSHRNFMANLKQIAEVLNTEQSDVVMASLPLFHAFGLTVTQFMPLIEGMPMVCHPDPTDVLGISKSIAKYRATIMCGTSTFLRLFIRNRKVHPLMLKSLRFVVAGAEKLRDDVREEFKLKFHHDILEGYGATETTPVASVNLPDALDMNYWQVQNGGKLGTVGMPLPGTSFKIVDPNTLEELPTNQEGMILIGGAQVMLGYLNNPAKTEEAIRMIDGKRWYVTGDKGRLDEDGFLTIVDRYSRFAKLAGEMVSLTQVEEWVRQHSQMDGEENSELDPEAVVAINVPDVKKGEKIGVLRAQHIDVDATKKNLLQAGCSNLMIPENWFTVATLPKLGSGKTDFTQAKKLALELLAAD